MGWRDTILFLSSNAKETNTQGCEHLQLLQIENETGHLIDYSVRRRMALSFMTMTWTNTTDADTSSTTTILRLSVE
jgi:hypothetical protein